MRPRFNSHSFCLLTLLKGHNIYELYLLSCLQHSKCCILAAQGCAKAPYHVHGLNARTCNIINILEYIEMKKTLFLSAILATALCSSAFAADHTYEGSENTNMQLNGYSAEDTITFKMGTTGTNNWFGNEQSTAAKILIEDDATTESVVEGLNITNGNQSYVTFSGAVSGSGAIQKTGAGTNLCLNFTGDVTEYSGNITLNAGNSFYLCFGSEATTKNRTFQGYGTAGTAPITSAEKGGSGTGNITFVGNGNSTLVYNYVASESPVYITNAIQRSNGGQVKVEFRGGASYVLTKDVVGFNSFTLADGSSFKYMGSSQITLTSAPASASTLEGVITNGNANLKFTGQYGANSGTLKNLRIEGLDASSGDASITLNGATGYFAQNSTQRNVTLAGNGMTQSDGYNGSSLTFQKLDGSGNYQKTYSGTMNYVLDDATAWTGSFISTAGTANVTFNGNSNADVIAKSAMNLTLKGTNYSDMHIKAFNGNTATVTVENSTSDVTIEQMIQDPSGRTSNGIMNVIINTDGHKVIVEEWATVNNVTLKGNSSVQFNNHNVNKLTVEAGNSSVFSGAGIGSDGSHKLGTLVVNSGAHLTFGTADTTVPTITLGGDSSITVGDGENHNFNLTVTTLTVGGDADMNANLVVNGGTLTFAKGAVLTMGCDVTISGSTVYVTIDGTFDAFMADLRAGNTSLVVIDGLESADEAKALTLNGLYITDSTGGTFTNNELGLKVVENTFTSNGAYAIVVAPEPATATLSLLALAALAARRKRH